MRDPDSTWSPPSPHDADEDFEIRRRWILKGERTMRCYLCYLEATGKPDMTGDKGPVRTIVSETTVNDADPTAAYRLDCGHIIIDL